MPRRPDRFWSVFSGILTFTRNSPASSSGNAERVSRRLSSQRLGSGAASAQVAVAPGGHDRFIIVGPGATSWAVRLSVARRGGWRAWLAVSGDFERDLAGQESDSVLTPHVEAESRRGPLPVPGIPVGLAWAAVGLLLRPSSPQRAGHVNIRPGATAVPQSPESRPGARTDGSAQRICRSELSHAVSSITRKHFAVVPRIPGR